MNHILNSNIFKYKNKYIKQKSDKLIDFKSFIDYDILIKIMKDLNFDYSIYNDIFYALRPLYLTKKNIYNNTTEIINDFSILKTKLFIFDQIISFYILLKYVDNFLNKNDNILLVSHNYGLVELMKYNNYNNVDHFVYNKQRNIYNKNIEKYIKTIYNFNDYKYGIKLDKKYKFMIFDLVVSRIYKEDIISEKLIKQKEHSNISLLEYLYDYLDSLEYNGNIMILISLFFTEETLLILEDIFNCFKYVKLYKFGYNIGFFPYIYCYKFKGKQEKQTKLSENFYNFVKNVYQNMIILADKYIKYNTEINNLIIKNPNSKQLKEIANKNYDIAEQIAKYIGFETYNYRDNLYYELSNYMQQFYILDQTINIKFNINQTIININDIIKINNNIILNDVQLINDKYYKLNRQQLYRPNTLLLNIESQIINNYSAIGEILNTNNKNKKIQITDQWIQVYELLNIINYMKIRQNQIINLLLIADNEEWIGPLAYYMKKNMTNYKLNNQIIKPIQYESNNIKSSDDNYNWIIIDNITDNKMLYSNILFILYNLKYNSNCIITLHIPIIHKIIIDLIYILYLSFDSLMFVKPIYKQFNNIFYIIGLNYHKHIINFDELTKLLNLNNEELNDISLIDDDYIHDFKFQFINVYNILMKNHMNIIDTKLFFTDFWQNISDSIKSEIKSAINTKNINYIEKYFNNFN
jgi:hypothetical protein